MRPAMALAFAQTSIYHDFPEMSTVRFRVTLYYPSPVPADAPDSYPLQEPQPAASPLSDRFESNAGGGGTTGLGSEWPAQPAAEKHSEEPVFCCVEDIGWQERLISPL